MVNWHYPKSVACFGGLFDPWEVERHVLIGRCFVPWIQGCVFPPFVLKFMHSTIFHRTCVIDNILDKYACKEC
jgi:hypothetical protein